MQGDETKNDGMGSSQGHVATLSRHLSLLEEKRKKKKKKKRSLPPGKCLITVSNHLTSPCIRGVCVRPNC